MSLFTYTLQKASKFSLIRTLFNVNFCFIFVMLLVSQFTLQRLCSSLFVILHQFVKSKYHFTVLLIVAICQLVTLVMLVFVFVRYISANICLFTMLYDVTIYLLMTLITFTIYACVIFLHLLSSQYFY